VSEVIRLKHVARIRPSNVDKKTADAERSVRLCNYTDVYYNDVIRYTTLRHSQAVESGEDASVGTLGVGVLHHPRDGRRYSFVLLEDTSLSLPAAIRSDLEARFGVFNGTDIVEPE
jgi:hypothetical protein